MALAVGKDEVGKKATDLFALSVKRRANLSCYINHGRETEKEGLSRWFRSSIVVSGAVW